MESTQNNKNINVNPEKPPPPWYGSNATIISNKSMDGNYMFQSRDPIISIPLDSVEKRPPGAETKGGGDGGGGGGGHGHGFQVEHPTSYLETIMHLFKGNVGSGIFAMGDAMKNAGIIVGPIVTLILGVICVHCQHMLLAAAKTLVDKYQLKSAPDFAETVELCFEKGPGNLQKLSTFMKKFVNFSLCITQLGFCCVYFVFISQNVKQVVDYYGYELDVHLHMAIILLPILLTALIRNLKFLAPFSTLANVFMIVGIVIVLYYATQDLPNIKERQYVASLGQMPLFFGTTIYAFEGIGLVIPLQNEMKQPKNFKRRLGVLNIGMTVVTILYISVGFLSYLKFGEGVRGSVTLNLAEDDKLAQSVKIIICLGILLTYSLQFYIAVDIMWPNVQQRLGPLKKYPVFGELLFRSVLVIVTFILAEAIPFLGLFISLVGAVSSTTLALIIPPMLEMVTYFTNGNLSMPIIFKDMFILLLGILGMITGGFESISSIVHAFQSQ